jgi:4-hydroxymandelate oxidase
VQTTIDTLAARRRLLRFLTSFPLLTAGSRVGWNQSLDARGTVRTSLDDILNVMEFEPLAKAALPPAHFGYLTTGVDDDRTVSANHDAFSRVQIRSSRFVDVSRLDTSIHLLGTQWPSPVYLSAVGSQRAFHPDAELGVARAAAKRSALLMLSSGSSTSVESVIEARGGAVWMQLYPTDVWSVTAGVVRRAQSAGCPAVVLTVDNMTGRNSETLQRAMRLDKRTCTDCHINNSHDFVRKAPMYSGLDISRVKDQRTPSNITWDFLDKLRQLVSVKLLVKGIVTGEDAAHCVARGVDGIVVSNHGGRTEETLHSTLECLPEVIVAVGGKVPVLLDGGIRRGTDVFKALALGASAVGIGRPQAWGLAAFGQPGVEKVLDIYERELRVIMRQAGTPSIASITAEHIVNKLS